MSGAVATKVAIRSGFFVYVACRSGVALMGFSPTFCLPIARGPFVALPLTYGQGTLASRRKSQSGSRSRCFDGCRFRDAVHRGRASCVFDTGYQRHRGAASFLRS
jgi:hypothetical protein